MSKIAKIYFRRKKKKTTIFYFTEFQNLTWNFFIDLKHFISVKCHGDAEVHRSRLQVRGGVHPGQVTNLLQG